MQMHGSLKNVAAGQTERPFQINGTEDLEMLNAVGNVGCILTKQFNTTDPKIFFDVVPAYAFFQIVWRVLNEHRQDVFAVRSIAGDFDGGIATAGRRP